jgi:MFS family permease
MKYILRALAMSQFHILYVVSLLMDMSVAGATFAISRRAAELGASAMELGLLGSVWLGAYTMLSLVSGRVSDRVGRRQVALTGAAVAAVIVFACAFVTGVKPLLALTAVFGAGIGCYWPSIIAWLGDGASGSRLMHRLTRFGIAWNIGLLLGFAQTGWLFQRDPRLAFYVAGASMAAIVALLFLRAPAAANAGNNDRPEDVTQVPKGRGFRKTAWLANFGLNLATGGAIALFPQLATSLGIAPNVHGALLALGRAAALAMFFALHAWSYWRARLWPLWIAQLLAAAGVASVAWGGSAAAFAAAFVVMGAVSGYTYQTSILFTLEEISEKGKGGGFHEAIVGGGMFAGPILAGWAGGFSMRAPYVFCAGALVALVGVQLVLVFWKRKHL